MRNVVFALATVAALIVRAELEITEICARCQPTVPAQKDLGWVELHNAGEASVNLRDYKIVVTNRGKKAKDADMSALLDREVAPGAYTLVYTSEMFPNGEKGTAVAEYDYGGFGAIMVVPKKINQKKYPMVQLYKGGKAIQTVFVPVDLADRKTYTTVPNRMILDTATPGAANGASGVPYGPNVSCLYGVKDALDPWVAFPRAKIGEDYTVRLPVNPIDLSAADDDRIASVRLVYRVAPGEPVTAEAAMEAVETNKASGVIWEGTVPGSAFTKAGQLVQFAVRITDGAGRTFRSPSFRNPDDGYEWYGTIVEPGDLDSARLQTFHLFVEGASLTQMDEDADRQDRAQVPYNARCGIYDSTTGMYYDNVRIDLRGNTSAGFHKKSHGLRFNKSQPLACTDPVTGTALEGIRKSSFVAEYVDPSLVRQYLSFKVFRDLGLDVPFHYPVRLNLNGEFYQLAFHSERFTDELIEDCFKFDPLGYSYKNVGTFSTGTTAGGTEKKTPDDEQEGDVSVLHAFCETFRDADGIDESYSGDGMATEIPSVTRTVVKSFDLPAWINYMAASRITHETDDVWANICAYYDVNGTGTWMPLAYDLQMSFGQYYADGDIGKSGAVADFDWFKSHPFYGGYRVRCHTRTGGLQGDGNRAFEAVWQSPKFRRLFLRRLRTVMDEVLKEPGTAREATPFWGDVVAVTNAAGAEAALDQAKWSPAQHAAGQWMYDWNAWLSVGEALDDMWTNYVEKRRVHLFVTHSVTNTAKAVGYGRDLNAGIPSAQSPVAALKGGFSFVLDAATGLPGADALVIRNANDEAVDLSGWTLSGSVRWTLPPGTVVDAQDEITVVADRRAYVAAHADALADRVIVGNAEFGEVAEDPLTLADAKGDEVVAFIPPPVISLGDVTATPGVDFKGSIVVLALGKDYADHGWKVTAELAVAGAEGPIPGTIDATAGTISFVLGEDLASAAEAWSGVITVSAAGETLTREVVAEQGRLVVTDESGGWIRESGLAIGATGSWSPAPQAADGRLALDDSAAFAPSNAMPAASVATIDMRLALGMEDDGDFATTAHAGVKVVMVAGTERYAFRTGAGVVTNLEAVAEAGLERDLSVTTDYRLRTVTYRIDEAVFGPYPLPAGAERLNGLKLTGEGEIAYVNGDYRTEALDASLAVAGGREYETVADAVASGEAVELLWDASWNPETAGAYTVATNGHRLVLGGSMTMSVVDNGDGTLTVRVVPGDPKAEPTTITLEGGKVRIGVKDPVPGFRYGILRAKKLGSEDDFSIDESSWRTGEDLLENATLEVEMTEGESAEFFRVKAEKSASTP